MRGSQRNTPQSPREYTLFCTGLPSALLPLLSPQLRWSNHRAAGGQGCEEAPASHDRTPPDETTSIKHKYRPQAPASPASSLPVPHALQSTVHRSPFSRKYTCKSLFSSPPSSPSPKRKKVPIKINRSLPQHAY